ACPSQGPCRLAAIGYSGVYAPYAGWDDYVYGPAPDRVDVYASGDADHDGTPEIFGLGTGFLAEWHSTPSSAPAQSFATPAYPYDAGVGDFDGDGNLDVAVLNQSV